MLFLGRRALDTLAFAFAALGFFCVPLGKHTGYEHTKAIFTTPAAQRAGHELCAALLRIRDQLVNPRSR